MFVRFVVAEIDPDSGHRTGLFVAMERLVDANALSETEEALWNDVKGWFNQNLKVPDRLTRSSYPRAKNVAISWFKDSAAEPIRRMHEIVQLLRQHDIDVEVIRSARPGYIVYEDEFQISAQPFRDTRT